MNTLLRLLGVYGLTFVAANVFLEQLGLPIPAVPTLVLAGALARGGTLSAPRLVIVAILAALAADSISFAIGRRYGGAAMKLVCRLSLSPDFCVRRTESLFTRLGPRALLVAKFVPGFSAVSTPLAGASGMGVGTFLLFDAAGSLIWSGSAVLLGTLFSRQIEKVLDALQSLGSGAVSFLLAALVLYLLVRAWERWRFARAFAITRIAPGDLASHLAGEAPPSLWDVRSEAARMRDRRAIPGARFLRLDALEEDFAGQPPDREIVLYCT